ncbi:MAG: aldehyde reductase [Myxococcota bacterium]
MARVLVTGASGFIAQHVILQLLEAGHEVRGTARSATKGEALKGHLAAHDPRGRELQVFEADLSRDAGWADAVAGCDYVQHVASPIPATLPKDHDELIKPARDGALRVLRAASDAGVKRCVMTSSMAAAAYGWGDALPSPIHEEHWSNPDNLQDNTAYTRSKTIAERAAWKFIEESDAALELSVINPTAVLGPALGPSASVSLELVGFPLKGKLPAVPDIGFPIVDVRDVARAHVLAMEENAAAGERFLVGEEYLNFADVVKILRQEFPDYRGKLSTRRMPSWLLRFMALFSGELKQTVTELGKQRRTTNEKAKKLLGWTPRPAREAVVAAAQSLIDYKLI